MWRLGQNMSVSFQTASSFSRGKALPDFGCQPTQTSRYRTHSLPRENDLRHAPGRHVNSFVLLSCIQAFGQEFVGFKISKLRSRLAKGVTPKNWVRGSCFLV